MVLVQLAGIYLFIDGLVSFMEYQKQKVLQQKNGKLISLHWAHKLEFSKMPKGTIKFIRQSSIEHLPRLARIALGLGLMFAPIPF